jgi:hypothetical protein
MQNQMKDLIAKEGIDNTEEASIMTQVLGGYDLARHGVWCHTYLILIFVS